MICIPIAAKTSEEAISLIKEAEKKADMTELRIDTIKKPEIRKIIIAAKKPVIATNRKKDEGGFFTGTEEERIRLIEEAVNEGAKYADVELSSGKEAINRLKGKCKLIVSHHNFKETPKELNEILKRINETGCDIIKIATLANDITDNIRMFELARKANSEGKKVIALCMGEKGEISRILYKKFGCFLTYSCLPGKETAPGQIPINLMKDVYRADKLNAQTKILGTIGNPARYSRSFYMFNPVYEKLGLNYVHLKLESDNLKEFLAEIKKLDPAGFSVTTPYKEEVIKYLDGIDETAKEIGAVNTIVVRNGKLIGYNTDGTGAKNAIMEKTGLENKRIVVIGAGGAAKAVAYTLSKEKCRITILNRTAAKTKELAKKLGCEYGRLDDIEKTRYDILINCTTVGMSPKESKTPIDKKHLRNTVMDIIYEPPVTRLLREAEEKGCQTIDGLSMLLQQGIEQFRLWTCREPPTGLMKESLWKSLSNQ